MQCIYYIPDTVTIANPQVPIVALRQIPTLHWRDGSHNTRTSPALVSYEDYPHLTNTSKEGRGMTLEGERGEGGREGEGGRGHLVCEPFLISLVLTKLDLQLMTSHTH